MSFGSSPRMRGTLISQVCALSHIRFIPAYAGNTNIAEDAHSSSSVHPRVCGEHSIVQARTGEQFGSSPRMRGTPLRGLKDCEIERFIPAYAGNTKSSVFEEVLKAVHPRVCGEHGSTIVVNGFPAGSSPRMRGTHLPEFGKPVCERFIPAYAGNTQAHCFRSFPYPVHPRVCGEHSVPDHDLLCSGGSSPRMRGTRSGVRIGIDPRRFIPAYAGNTDGSNAPMHLVPVHPRVCGEHISHSER